MRKLHYFHFNLRLITGVDPRVKMRGEVTISFITSRYLIKLKYKLRWTWYEYILMVIDEGIYN